MGQNTKNEISKLLKQFNDDPLTKRLVDKYCAPIIYDDVFGICHLEAMHTNFLKG